MFILHAMESFGIQNIPLEIGSSLENSSDDIRLFADLFKHKMFVFALTRFQIFQIHFFDFFLCGDAVGFDFIFISFEMDDISIIQIDEFIRIPGECLFVR